MVVKEIRSRGICCMLWLACVGFGSTCALAVDSLATSDPIIEIWKAERRMEFRHGSKVIREFRIALGESPVASKEVQGDGRTPEGRYYVSDKVHGSRFRRFIGISYPNLEDAERGYELQRISAVQWSDIFFANLQKRVPPWNTKLGGRIGIHGYAGRPYLPVINWTQGCVAVSDEEIDFLFGRVPIGTPVEIHE
jgi:murein L,D-transpeptidase YafK